MPPSMPPDPPYRFCASRNRPPKPTWPGRSLAILNAPEGWADRIFEALGEGVLVRGCHNIFATARDGMQKLQYTMKI